MVRVCKGINKYLVALHVGDKIKWTTSTEMKRRGGGDKNIVASHIWAFDKQTVTNCFQQQGETIVCSTHHMNNILSNGVACF